jgi:hypothetical protein
MSDKFRLFQYAVILHKKETREGKTEYVGAEVIIEPATMMARNEKEAAFKITRMIPEEKATSPDDIDIIIRNF